MTEASSAAARIDGAIARIEAALRTREESNDALARRHAALKARGILVKNVEPMHPLLGGCLRLTVGAPEENRRMLDALAAALATASTAASA